MVLPMLPQMRGQKVPQGLQDYMMGAPVASIQQEELPQVQANMSPATNAFGLPTFEAPPLGNMSPKVPEQPAFMGNVASPQEGIPFRDYQGDLAIPEELRPYSSLTPPTEPPMLEGERPPATPQLVTGVKTSQTLKKNTPNASQGLNKKSDANGGVKAAEDQAKDNARNAKVTGALLQDLGSLFGTGEGGNLNHLQAQLQQDDQFKAKMQNDALKAQHAQKVAQMNAMRERANEQEKRQIDGAIKGVDMRQKFDTQESQRAYSTITTMAQAATNTLNNPDLSQASKATQMMNIMLKMQDPNSAILTGEVDMAKDELASWQKTMDGTDMPRSVGKIVEKIYSGTPISENDIEEMAKIAENRFKSYDQAYGERYREMINQVHGTNKATAGTGYQIPLQSVGQRYNSESIYDGFSSYHKSRADQRSKPQINTVASSPRRDNAMKYIQ